MSEASHPEEAQTAEPSRPPWRPWPLRRPSPASPTLEQTLPAQARRDRSARSGQQLAKAKSDLDRVDYKALNPDAQGAVRHGEAVHRRRRTRRSAQKNLVFAVKVAEKAAGLAAGLLGRDDSLRP